MFGVESFSHKNMGNNDLSDLNYTQSGNNRPLRVVPVGKQGEPLVDLNALDKRAFGVKETDLSLLNKRQPRRPGGSLANAASQHLKHSRPSSPVLPNNNNPFPSNSRGNSISSASSGSGSVSGNGGNFSPLNPKFSPRPPQQSPPNSIHGAPPHGAPPHGAPPHGAPPHGFYPPRGRSTNSPNKSPQSPQFGRVSSIEIIAMEEKIKELQSELNDKDQQLRKSLSIQNPVMDEKVLKQYNLLEQENSLLSKELSSKNKELLNKIKELQEKNEIIKEMEIYTNEQFDKINQFEQEKISLKASYDNKLNESNEMLIKQRHNIKFEYDAIIENKMNANQKLNDEIKELNDEINLLKENKNEEHSIEVSNLTNENDQLFGFLIDLFKDLSNNFPNDVLKEKISLVEENPALVAINNNYNNQLLQILSDISDINIKEKDVDLSDLTHQPQSSSDMSPSVFSDVPVTYTHQNHSYATSISRSSSIYSKTNKDNQTTGASSNKSVSSTPEKKSTTIELVSQDENDQEGKEINEVANMSNETLLRDALKELSKNYEIKNSIYHQKITSLVEQLLTSNYLVTKQSITHSTKNKSHHEHISKQQKKLIKLTNELKFCDSIDEVVKTMNAVNEMNSILGMVSPSLANSPPPPPATSIQNKRGSPTGSLYSFIGQRRPSDVEEPMEIKKMPRGKGIRILNVVQPSSNGPSPKHWVEDKSMVLDHTDKMLSVDDMESGDEDEDYDFINVNDNNSKVVY